MKTCRNSKAFALSSALLTLVTGPVYANPEVAMDFGDQSTDPSTSSVLVTNTNPVLSKVIVTCPTDPDSGNFAGYLVATASAQFTVDNGSPDFTYYVKKNSEHAIDHLYYVSEDGQFSYIPPIQRVDTCNEGETITYRFQANEDDAGQGTVVATKPRLVVVFYKDKI